MSKITLVFHSKSREVERSSTGCLWGQRTKGEGQGCQGETKGRAVLPDTHVALTMGQALFEALHKLNLFNLLIVICSIPTSEGRHYYYSHFTNKETGNKFVKSLAQGYLVVQLGFEARSSRPRGHAHERCAPVLLNAVGRSGTLKTGEVVFSSTEVFSSLTESHLMELNTHQAVKM